MSNVLSFESQALEQEFASHFGWRCRVPTFLLSFVLFLIWTTRLISAQGRTDVPHIWLVSTFLFVMASIHLVNTVIIYKNPAVCCGEKRKATYLILDAVCCMVMVLVYSHDTGVNPDNSAPTRLIINTPFMVYAIHGWADVYLHALNLQLYLLSKFQMQGFSKERCPTLYSAAAAFCVFTLVPVAINIAYEANARSAYLARRNLPHNDLNNFWQQVLRWGVTPDVQT